MYEKRVKVFIGVSLAVLLLCVLRLVQLQVLTSESLRQEITQATEPGVNAKQLKTLRGKILDCRGKIIAEDVPQFQICINYRLSCFLDERVLRAKYAPARTMKTSVRVAKEIDDKWQDLERIIEKCTRFGPSRAQIEANITALNNAIWNARTFLCWARNSPDPNLIAQYGGINNVPSSQAAKALEGKYPDEAGRYKKILAVPLADLGDVPTDAVLVELKTEEDASTAQVEMLEFTDMNEIQVLAAGRRYCPYRSAAAQTIGWVGGATQPRDVNAFAGDPLASYRAGEVCGREGGVEYACEGLLRGRRGEIVYDSDGKLVRQTETEFGKDIRLTLDIALQQQIEQRLTDPKLNPDYYKAPMAGALIDVGSGDILALLSLPSYDLNTARYSYGDLVADPNHPLWNRALNPLYPPGSVAKPTVLVAGLESGAILPDDVIFCPADNPPPGWPKCLIWWKSHSCHDALWRNTARNATKGSCNIYFSRLADRIDARVLQEWLYRFGYGHEVPLAYPEPSAPGSIPRHLRQWPGEIGSTPVSASTDTESFDQIPPLADRDRKMFGIGQGNFRVTPLQVANAFATLARHGQVKPPRLFLSPETPAATPVDLPISAATLQVVYDGMHAVVNEEHGTAYTAFRGSDLTQRGVTVYGKTGSTERPFDAWFAGFAEDRDGRKLALAIVVEGGQHGGGDAGPLARQVLELCVEAGYIGHNQQSGARAQGSAGR